MNLLDNVCHVVKHSKEVHIDREKLLEFCKDIAIHAPTLLAPPFKPLAKISTFSFILDALAFCFWGEPKWTITYQGKDSDGWDGMRTALLRANDEGKPITKPNYWQTMDRHDFAEITRGQGTIPLLYDRVAIVRELGCVLSSEYEGNFQNVLDTTDHAETLLECIVNDFPSFNDIATSHGLQVPFHKRAQLLIYEIHTNIKTLHGIDKLTAFADYKIPQVLRNNGILRYSIDLARIVDTKTELLCGEKEIEIRANTIYAVELIKHVLHERDPTLTSAEIGTSLWLLGQHKNPSDKPYHRTRTTFY